MDNSQRTNSWTNSMWKAVQRYAAALVPQEDDGTLPLTNQQAHQLETQQSSDTIYRQAVLNDLGGCLELAGQSP
jgi:hypothetical protein